MSDILSELKKQIRRSGKTVPELAKELGTHTTSLYGILSGRRPVSEVMLERIARSAGCTIKKQVVRRKKQ